MVRRIPEWETELWHDISQGDGKQCPMIRHCRNRQTGGYCANDNLVRMSRLHIVDDREFSLRNYNFVRYGTCGRLAKAMELLGKRYLKNGGVHSPPVPEELVSLADEQNNIEIRRLPLKAYHGATWLTSEGWVIQLREDDSPIRQRFTLFHEAFHILAHCRVTAMFGKREARRGPFNEMLADYFAHSVLMPIEWVDAMWTDIRNLDMMARVFDVPKSAMCIRLRYMGLI